MEFVFDDCGRAAAGYKGMSGDCVTRSIYIATGKTYQQVYDALYQLAQTERTGKRKRRWPGSRAGAFRRTYQHYLESLGWRWLSHVNWFRMPGSPACVRASARSAHRRGVAAPHCGDQRPSL